MKQIPIIVILTVFIQTASPAQAPAGYYDATSGLYGDSLKESLHLIISGHTPVLYNQIYTYFASTDARPNNTVWDMYSDVPGGTPPYVYQFVSADQCGNYSQEGDCFNREHSFPKSWFGGEVMPMYSDLFHVYPTDGFVNGQRGNLPYGETNSPSWISLNGSKRGTCSAAGYSGDVFEPLDEYKGDFARTYFYMAVRYYGEDSAWPGSPMTVGAEPKAWALDMLIDWHETDTVSLKERQRNNAVYNIQGNRNPFIDDPFFAERIWTTSAGINPEAGTGPEVFLFPQPARDELSITFKEDRHTIERVVLMDALGRECLEQEVTGKSLRLDLRSLPPGLYFIGFGQKSGGLDWVQKLLISG